MLGKWSNGKNTFGKTHFNQFQPNQNLKGSILSIPLHFKEIKVHYWWIKSSTQKFLCQVENILTVHTHTHTPVDWADTGHAVIVTHSLCQQSVSDLPGKHGGVLAFVISDFVDDFGCSNLWFGASDHPWSDAACLIVPVEQIDRELYFTRQDKQR